MTQVTSSMLAVGIAAICLTAPDVLRAAPTEPTNTGELSSDQDREGTKRQELVDLNGFRLMQFASGADVFFGEPDHVIELEGVEYRGYNVTDASYMLFGHSTEIRVHNVISIQITGYPTEMIPFNGLSLGDPAANVVERLGAPSQKEPGEMGLDVWTYEDLNYSVEIDPDGRLYSIRLRATQGLVNVTEPRHNMWEEFGRAAAAGDLQRLMSTMRPDIEIDIDGGILSNKTRHLEFVEDPGSQFRMAMLGEKRSVRAALAESDPTKELRITQHSGAGWVYKFYEGTVVEEIVLFPYLGGYRIYAISFFPSRPPGD
jgi:hypothetical protein